MVYFISKLERSFEALAQGISKRPGKVIGIILVLSFALIAGMSRLYIDVTNESLFLPGAPTLQQYHSFQEQFGRDDAALAAIESPDIFTLEFLTKLEAYHKELAATVPYLDKITSLVNVTAISEHQDELLINDLQELWPQQQQDFPAFKQFVLQNPLYRNIIVSEDGRLTLVIVRSSAFATEEIVPPKPAMGFKETIIAWHNSLFLGEDQKEPTQTAPPSSVDEIVTDDFPVLDEDEFLDIDNQTTDEKSNLSTSQLAMFIEAVREVTAKHHTADFPIRLTGGPVVDQAHIDSIHSDVGTLVVLCVLFVLLILFYLLRNPAAVMLAMLTVILSMLTTLGLMGWIGSPMTPVAVALPPLLLTIGVVDSVHLLSVYFVQLQKTGDRQASIVYAVRRTCVAILFTSLTTAAGFMAFSVAELRPIAEFAYLMTFGVMVALIYSLVLIPAMLYILPAAKKNMAFLVRWQQQVKGLLVITQISLRHSQRVLIGTLILIVLALPGITQLRFAHDVLKWFPQDHEVRVNTIAIDKIIHGSVPLEVVIDTGQPNGIYSPDFMRRLEAFEAYSETLDLPDVQMGRTTSIVDSLKRIHAVLNNEMATQSIPSDPKLVAQELLFFESSGAENVAELVDSQFSMVRITVRMSWVDAVKYLPLRNQLADKAEQMFGDMATVTVTGSVNLMSQSIVGVMHSMASGYLIAGVVIALMLILLFGNIGFGLASLIPNFLPIYLSLSIMGYLGLPINMFTVLLGGVALGLAVDDTVHFMHGVRYRCQELGMSLEKSIEETIAITGPALLFTTLSLAGGFFVFMLSSMNSLFYFGVVIGMTIITALIADLFIGPALIQSIQRRGWMEPHVKPGG